jgi:endonuclease YncB( thermonuclease family)
MARRGPKGTWRAVLLLVVAAVLWLADSQRDPARPSSRGSGPTSATSRYEQFTGCRLEDHRQNDGDSFRVRFPDGRVEQLRLYFVDAPESAFRSYANGEDNHDRIADQARDFGTTAQQAVEIGKQAKQRTHDLLSRAPFTVHTRWDDPFGDRRYHALIQPAGGPWLHESLVREGLVRIHTKPADLPDGTSANEHLRDLRKLEEAARRQGTGAWGMSRR